MLDLRIGQFRVDRQAEATFGRPFRDRIVAGLSPEFRETFLKVQGQRVMQRGPNAFGLEMLAQLVALGMAHDVEMVDAFGSG